MIKKILFSYARSNISFGIGIILGTIITSFVAGIMIYIMLDGKTVITTLDIQDCLEEKVKERLRK